MNYSGKKHSLGQKLFRKSRISAAVIETLEPRRLLSSVSFAAVTSYPLAGSGSNNAIAVANFNGSGRPDVAAITGSTLSVIYGNLDGTFGTPVVLTNNAGSFVTIADVNGDGYPDILAGNPSGASYSLNVFLNNGSGGFPSKKSTSLANQPVSVSVGEFDSNDETDLILTTSAVVSGNTEQQISLLLSNGDGTFSEATLVAGEIPDARYSVAVGDFNGSEGIVIASSGSPTVTYLLGNGSGHFTTNIFTAGFDPTSVIAADVNGDGRQDLILSYGADKQIEVLLAHNDNSGFTTTSNHSFCSDQPFTTLQTANLNGNADLVLSDGENGTIETLLGNKAGGFPSDSVIDTSNRFNSITVGDVNGDNKPDIVVFYYGGDDVPVPSSGETPVGYYGAARVFLGNGDGEFHNPTQGAFFDGDNSGNSDAVAIFDVNGDGHPDILAAGYGRLFVTFGNGDGTFVSQRQFYSYSGVDTLAVEPFIGTQLGIATAGDDNLSEDNSFVYRRANSANVLGVNAEGVVLSPTVFAEAVTNETVIAGDFNGDGQMDIATVGYSSAIEEGVLRVLLLHNSSGTLTVQTTEDLADGHVNGLIDGRPSIAAADFSGDGRDDIVAVYENGGNHYLAVFISNSNGTFKPPELCNTGSYDPYGVAIGDFNGDGNLDIAAISQSHITVFLGNGDGTFNNTDAIVSNIDSISQYSTIVAANLVSGSSKADLVIAGSGGVQVLIANTAGYFNSPSVVQNGPTVGLAVTDFNGDGYPDIVTSLNNHGVAVLLGNGNGTFQPAQTVAWLDFAPESFAVGTFSGDGGEDIVAAGYENNYPQISILVNTTPDYWTGKAGNQDWGDGANWTEGVPGSGEAAYIPSESYTIDVNGDYSVGVLDSVAPLSIPSSDELTVLGDSAPVGQTDIAGDITLDGTLSIDTGSSVSPVVVGNFTGTGTLGVGTALSVGYLQIQSNSGAIAMNSLSIATDSSLDVTNNALTINFSVTDPASTIRGYLTSGYDDDTWEGAGINSSSAHANVQFAVGYDDGARDVGTPAGSNQGTSEKPLLTPMITC